MNMKQTKRAQAALEFLTTYGWAFLVILIMIGALAYFGVLNPSNLVPDSCTAGDGFTCQEYVASTTDPELQLIVVNTLQSVNITDIRIEEISSSSCGTITPATDITSNIGGTSSDNTPNLIADSGDTFRINLNCPGTLSSGERIQGTAIVSYKPVGNTLGKTLEVDFSVKAD